MAVDRRQQALQECRETINSTLMYLYETHRALGLSEEKAKEAVAEELVRRLEQWESMTGLVFSRSAIINPLKVLDELIDTARKEGAKATIPADTRAAWQNVYRRLVDLKAAVRK